MNYLDVVGFCGLFKLPPCYEIFHLHGLYDDDDLNNINLFCFLRYS